MLDDAVARGRRIGVALSDDELRRIAEHLDRVPSDTELFAFDAQWSEHCSYKSSREHLRKLPTEGPTVLLGVGEDAGIVRLGEWQGETYGIVVAHESHNLLAVADRVDSLGVGDGRNVDHDLDAHGVSLARYGD